MRQYLIFTNYDCNLNCSYCYECKKWEDVFDPEAAFQYIVKRIDEDAPSPGEDIMVYCIGGEAFLHTEKLDTLFSKVLPYVHSLGCTPILKVQTNGTLLTGNAQQSLLKKYSDCLYLGFSIDGAKAKHDRDRCGSFDAAIAGLRAARDILPRDRFTVKATFTVQDIPFYADNVTFLLGLDVKGVIANFAVQEKIPMEQASILAEQMCLVVQWMKEHPGCAEWGELKYPGDRVTLGCGLGGGSRCISPDGKEYQCIQFACNKRTIPPNWKEEMKRACATCENCILFHECNPCYAYTLGDVEHVRPWCAYTWARAFARAFYMLVTPEKEDALWKTK